MRALDTNLEPYIHWFLAAWLVLSKICVLVLKRRGITVVKLKSLAKFEPAMILVPNSSFLRILWSVLFLLLWAASMTESLDS